MAVPIITLLTDFGIRDGYVAGMKGVILGICPEALIVDISHLIPPQDIRAGAFVLSTVYRDFPPETIHVAVVDPGVGTQRRAVAVRAGDYYFVGPDNGLFSWILASESPWTAHCLENREYWRPWRNGLSFGKTAGEGGSISATFHGRDIFAPVAAHLARSVRLEALGPACAPHIALWSEPVREGEELRGEVIYVDRFGNGITNIRRPDIEPFLQRGRWQRIVQVNGSKGSSRVNLVQTYGEVAPGTAIALIGSSEWLEIAVNQGSAAERLNIGPGSTVCLLG
jgi:S-adenosylmethionine hydrolase